MIVSIIVAVADNGVIGRGNELPWRLAADLKRFKAITMGKPIIMGRKTHESIGRPLPGRKNIVVTRNPAYVADGCVLTDSLASALAAAHEADAEEVAVIGGAELYAAALPLATRIYMTRVHTTSDGDTHFPRWDPNDWRDLVEPEEFAADEQNEYATTFYVLGSWAPAFTRQRDAACRVAAADYRLALQIAHGIDEPWFRCQSLAAAAMQCPDANERTQILDASFADAERQRSPNRIVSVASWPLEVLAEHGELDELKRRLEHFIGIIGSEPSPVKRADALDAVLSRIRSAPKDVVLSVVKVFAAACLQPLVSGKRNSKGEGHLARWIPHVWSLNRALAESLLAQIEGPEHRQRALDGIETRERKL